MKKKFKSIEHRREFLQIQKREKVIVDFLKIKIKQKVWRESQGSREKVKKGI